MYTVPWRIHSRAHAACLQMSASNAIQHQFDIACRFQQHATSIVSVLLLDEVGLAEHSPDMPLKVLHAMLVKPPIAIVGLSNWTLDSAKMNRAICIQRTEPSTLDIEVTAHSIVGTPTAGSTPSNNLPKRPERQATNERKAEWLSPVCFAYHVVYTAQEGRDLLLTTWYLVLIYLLLTTYLLRGVHCSGRARLPWHAGLVRVHQEALHLGA